MLREWLESAWYRFCYAGVYVGGVFCFSFRFEGGRNIPKTGPVLLIANHQSFFDPLLVGLAVVRPVSYMARASLFKNRLFGAMLRSVGVFPVDQEGVAKEGLKQVIQQLNAGKPVLIFPEGTRTKTGAMQPLRPGLLLALKRTHAPIVPVGVAGAFQLFPRQNKLPHLAPLFLPAPHGGLAVSVGRPLAAQRYLDLPREQALKELGEKIAEMQKRAEKLRRKD